MLHDALNVAFMHRVGLTANHHSLAGIHKLFHKNISLPIGNNAAPFAVVCSANRLCYGNSGMASACRPLDIFEEAALLAELDLCSLKFLGVLFWPIQNILLGLTRQRDPDMVLLSVQGKPWLEQNPEPARILHRLHIFVVGAFLSIADVSEYWLLDYRMGARRKCLHINRQLDR